MAGFNNNNRLQDHIMYSLDWAIFLRHNIEDPLIPFLFEWEDEKIYKNMLQPGGDPEDFAYRIAEKSERNSDQFVLGYEGMLTDQSGEKMDAFIIKGYDKTQKTGVFIAQIFNPKEKVGNFILIDKPMLIGNPDLPFSIKTDLKPNYETEELYASGMVVDNNDQVAILSHFNPSVVASGIKNFMRGKLQGEESSKLSGNLEISIAPQESFGEFFKYTITRVIEEELNSDYAKLWIKRNNRNLVLNCKHGDDLIYSNSDEQNKSLNESNNEVNNSKNESNEEAVLIKKYQSFSKLQLDNEFNHIVSIPNARTNVECLKQMSALMQVYESKGFEMPGSNSKQQVKPKSGCMSIILILIITIVAVLLT